MQTTNNQDPEQLRVHNLLKELSFLLCPTDQYLLQGQERDWPILSPTIDVSDDKLIYISDKLSEHLRKYQNKFVPRDPN